MSETPTTTTTTTTTTTKTTTPRRVVFVHPDLGIGGAERLVVDAAAGLQALGHTVTVLTSHCDAAHCFDEARDGTLDVRVRGGAVFPPALRGRCRIVLAVLRQLSLVARAAVLSAELAQLRPDVIVVDQLSACIPFFRLLQPTARILFYGHYPDLRLVPPESGLRRWVQRCYRVPFDALEGWTTACADRIVVNSKYTRNVFRSAFPALRPRALDVLYPGVDARLVPPAARGADIWPGRTLLLSINRFECKKDLGLAIRAYAGLSALERSKAQLVLAGGYDPRNAENAHCHEQLQRLADSLRLTHATFRPQDTALTDLADDDTDLVFLLSIPAHLKAALLQTAALLVYTPTNEHFGIVPLEAMLAGVPVLATNTGGPLETIYHGRTGWLCRPDKVDEWTAVMRKPLIPASADELRKMGERGRARVLAEFSLTKMVQAFDQEIQNLSNSSAQRPRITPVWLRLALLTAVLAVIAAYGIMRLPGLLLSKADAGSHSALSEL